VTQPTHPGRPQVLQPPVVLVSSLLAPKVNPSGRVTLSGSVTDSERGGFIAFWNVTAGSLSGGGGLAGAARSAIVVAEPPAGRGTVPVTLVLRGGSLLPGMTYTIRLTATNSRASGFSQVGSTAANDAYQMTWCCIRSSI
jgi:hypothetical protein